MTDTAIENEELKKDQILRHLPTLLHRWHGNNAALYDLTCESVEVKEINEEQ